MLIELHWDSNVLVIRLYFNFKVKGMHACNSRRYIAHCSHSSAGLIPAACFPGDQACRSNQHVCILCFIEESWRYIGPNAHYRAPTPCTRYSCKQPWQGRDGAGQCTHFQCVSSSHPPYSVICINHTTYTFYSQQQGSWHAAGKGAPSSSPAAMLCLKRRRTRQL